MPERSFEPFHEPRDNVSRSLERVETKLRARLERAFAPFEFQRHSRLVFELAERWAISESAVYQGKCGTAALTRIRFGNSLRFLREEVERIEQDLIRKASRHLRRSEDMVA